MEDVIGMGGIPHLLLACSSDVLSSGNSESLDACRARVYIDPRRRVRPSLGQPTVESQMSVSAKNFDESCHREEDSDEQKRSSESNHELPAPAIAVRPLHARPQ